VVIAGGYRRIKKYWETERGRPLRIIKKGARMSKTIVLTVKQYRENNMAYRKEVARCCLNMVDSYIDIDTIQDALP
jgi:hypothetical protein